MDVVVRVFLVVNEKLYGEDPAEEPGLAEVHDVPVWTVTPRGRV